MSKKTGDIFSKRAYKSGAKTTTNLFTGLAGIPFLGQSSKTDSEVELFSDNTEKYCFFLAGFSSFIIIDTYINVPFWLDIILYILFLIIFFIAYLFIVDFVFEYIKIKTIHLLKFIFRKTIQLITFGYYYIKRNIKER